jgi:redox-sensing transcriptional repressor
MKNSISKAVIKRLPRYYRYLSDMLRLDITRVSSKELSDRMGITASQIRQDLNCFGGFGQQGYGYNIEFLYNEIGSILGLDTRFKVVIVGAGNMGRALANHSYFEKRGFDLVGIFDVNEALIGEKIRGVEIRNLSEIEKFFKENNVDIAILTVPFGKTSELAEKVINLGVKGIWNYSLMDIKASQDVIIENVHLSDSLMVLGYEINQKYKKERKK